MYLVAAPSELFYIYPEQAGRRVTGAAEFVGFDEMFKNLGSKWSLRAFG